MHKLDSVRENVIEEWVEIDPMEASMYIAGMEPGSDQDAAIEILAKQITNEDPYSALHWAAVMNHSDPEKKEAVIRSVVTSLQDNNRLDDDFLNSLSESNAFSEEDLQTIERLSREVKSQ